MPNIELLTQVRDLIKAQPEKLDMSTWATVNSDSVDLGNGTTAKVSCGTTACIAGWAVQLAGHKLLVNLDSRPYDGSFLINQSVAKNGRAVDIEESARKLLGLTEKEVGVLFYAPELLDRLIAGEDIVKGTEYDGDYDDYEDEY
jgi:hypothetical protein